MDYGQYLDGKILICTSVYKTFSKQFLVRYLFILSTENFGLVDENLKWRRSGALAIV